MTTYCGKLLHRANGTSRLTLETEFVDEPKAQAFLDDVITLIEKHMQRIASE